MVPYQTSIPVPIPIPQARAGMMEDSLKQLCPWPIPPETEAGGEKVLECLR